MKKLFVFLYICGVFCYGNIFEPLKITITNLDSKAKTASFPAMDLKVGESGIIRHKFDDNYSSIIGIATIIKIDSGNAIASITSTNILSQKYLPMPTNKPAQNDEIYFRLFNNNAFIIAPDLDTYEHIRTTHSQVHFLNSDLMVGYLFDSGGFDPKPKFLTKVCQIYNVGLLYIVTQNKLNILDCQSLVVVADEFLDTSNVKSSIAPFFSRIQYISSGSLDSTIKAKKSKNYFEYYHELVAQGLNFKK